MLSSGVTFKVHIEHFVKHCIYVCVYFTCIFVCKVIDKTSLFFSSYTLLTDLKLL